MVAFHRRAGGRLPAALGWLLAPGPRRVPARRSPWRAAVYALNVCHQLPFVECQSLLLVALTWPGDGTPEPARPARRRRASHHLQDHLPPGAPERRIRTGRPARQAPAAGPARSRSRARCPAVFAFKAAVTAADRRLATRQDRSASPQGLPSLPPERLPPPFGPACWCQPELVAKPVQPSWCPQAVGGGPEPRHDLPQE